MIVISNCMATIIACRHTKRTEQVSTIDRALQVKTTSILENKLSEINASSGQVIIMKVQTGHIKALVELERRDSANYQSCRI